MQPIKNRFSHVRVGTLPLPRQLVPEPWPAIPERLELVLRPQKTLAYAYM